MYDCGIKHFVQSSFYCINEKYINNSNIDDAMSLLAFCHVVFDYYPCLPVLYLRTYNKYWCTP